MITIVMLASLLAPADEPGPRPTPPTAAPTTSEPDEGPEEGPEAIGDPGPAPDEATTNDEPSSDEPPSEVPEGPPSDEPAAEVPEEPPSEPMADAMAHLDRALTLQTDGDLDSAEAEASVAIALAPDDPAAYLARAQIRIELAERPFDGDEHAARRARAALLRQAAEDVSAYLERAGLSGEAQVFLETRRDALLRDADALDPPAPVVSEPLVAEPEPEPEPRLVTEPAPPRRRRWTRGTLDVSPRYRTAGLVASGAALGAGAVGLSAAGLQIRQSCVPDGPCAVDWRVRTPVLAPAIVLAALGTTSIVAGIASAPGMARPRTRRIVGTTTLALGSAAAVVGTVTGALVGARWDAPISPSDDASLMSTQALGNASLASFTAALPLLSAGVTAWLSGRRTETGRMARRTARR